MISEINISTKEFVRLHSNDDPIVLAMNKVKYKHIDIEYAIRDISVRKKLISKMPEWADNFNLIMPHSLNVEQSSSYLTAKYKAGLREYSSSVDLTCGFGIDSFFIAAKSEHHICIDSSNELSKLTASNFDTLKLHNTDCINSTTEHFLKRNSTIFDFVYIDPSRRDEGGNKKIRPEDCQPDIINLYPDLKRIARYLVIKLSPMMDISLLLRLFPEVNEIHVLSVDSECKELLLVFDFLSHIPNVQFYAVELSGNKFEYIFEKDDELEINYGLPQKYLYDTHPAITKSGFGDSYTMALGLAKLGINTNLYTSDIYHQNFSGKVFELIRITKPDKKEVGEVLPDKRAVVIKKDFPLAVESIRKKYKIREGSEFTIFAVKLLDSKHAFLISRRIK
jgi:hypothetical protein